MIRNISTKYFPGFHKTSVAYESTGHRRYNQPFSATSYGPEFSQGDVIGVGYRPRSGTLFFTRNGKKLDDVVHGLKSQNFFPTVGANGPCSIHVNFGQMGFVFIEANVKKWGLAPMTGSLAPPPPYGSEQGSILLETGRDGPAPPVRGYLGVGNRGGGSHLVPPTSPGPLRSPTDISLAQLSHIPSHEDIGEGSSRVGMGAANDPALLSAEMAISSPPPAYASPVMSRRNSNDGEAPSQGPLDHGDQPPIPSYEAAVGNRDNQRDDAGEH